MKKGKRQPLELFTQPLPEIANDVKANIGREIPLTKVDEGPEGKQREDQNNDDYELATVFIDEDVVDHVSHQKRDGRIRRTEQQQAGRGYKKIRP